VIEKENGERFVIIVTAALAISNLGVAFLMGLLIDEQARGHALVKSKLQHNLPTVALGLASC
jgi:hypothetical protein